MKPLSRDQVRRVDMIAIEEYGMPGVVLMENAGRGAAEIITRVSPEGPIVILCGKGNNGGDGYVIARHLELLGHNVSIISVEEPEQLAGDALINAMIAVKAEIPIERVCSADGFDSATTIVDCLLGTGASGELREPYRGMVESANASQAIRIAIDIPTGLDCDTGEASNPTFRADHTITFVAAKVGLLNPGANEYVGRIHEVGIGVPKKLLDAFVDV